MALGKWAAMLRSPVIGKDPAINPGGYKAGGPITAGAIAGKKVVGDTEEENKKSGMRKYFSVSRYGASILSHSLFLILVDLHIISFHLFFYGLFNG